MTTHRISEATAAFARIDGIDDSRAPQLDKQLRHLTQRHYLPPVERAGRADLYSTATVCALRLAERASAFGIDRPTLDKLLRFLHAAPALPTRWRQADGVRIALTVIEEAVDRARAGEDFDIGFTMGRDGRPLPKAWFPADAIPPEALAILDADRAANRAETVDAVFHLPAGRLIREVLDALGA